MKNDLRHLHRRDLIKEIFAFCLVGENANTKDLSIEAKEILAKNIEFDTQISEFALKHKENNIASIDRAILYLALFELQNKTAPPKVILNEALVLAHEYGSDKSSGFVNAVLAKIINI